MSVFDFDPNEWAGDTSAKPDPGDMCPGCMVVVTYGESCDECAALIDEPGRAA